MTLVRDRTRAVLLAILVLCIALALFVPMRRPQALVAAPPPSAVAEEPRAGISYAIDTVVTQRATTLVSGRASPIPVSRGDAVAVNGWVLDPQTLAPALRIDMRIDTNIPVVVDDYGVYRPDVAHVIGSPGAAFSGFRAVVPVAGLAPGNHRIMFDVRVRDGRTLALPTPLQLTVR